MEVILKGDVKEIAALVVALQERLEENGKALAEQAALCAKRASDACDYSRLDVVLN